MPIATRMFFGDIANCHKIFKVKTVGDCYVDVMGLRKVGKGHAVTIICFAMLRHHIFTK